MLKVLAIAISILHEPDQGYGSDWLHSADWLKQRTVLIQYEAEWMQKV